MTDVTARPVPAVRLARHRIRLDDGHPVGVAIAGHGMPFVVAHGFAAQGLLYTQTLSRLVSMGFKVVAIDTAGHGRTTLPGFPAIRLQAYTDLLSRSVDRLGIRKAVLLGHSMGGRLVADLAAERPELAVAVLPVDAILGADWDAELARLRRHLPIAGGVLCGQLAYDTLTTLPLADRVQTAKLLSLMIQTGLTTMRPRRLAAPALAILLAGGSDATIEGLRRGSVPVIALHGDRDLGVSLSAARDVVDRTDGTLVVIRGGRHSWLLRDPETLPAIVAQLLSGPLGDAWRASVQDAGLDPASANLDDIERVTLSHGALVRDLTPPLSFSPTGPARKRPTFRWSIETAR